MQLGTQVPFRVSQEVPLGHRFVTPSQATHAPVASSQIVPELAQDVCVQRGEQTPDVVSHRPSFGHRFVVVSHGVHWPVVLLQTLPELAHEAGVQRGVTHVPFAMSHELPLGHKFVTLSQATHRPVVVLQTVLVPAHKVGVHDTHAPLFVSHSPLGHRFVVLSQATHRPVVASQILPAHEAEVHGAAASGLPLRPAAITRTIKTIASAAITRIMYTGAHKILATSSGRPQQTRRAESSVFRARAGAHQEQGPPSDRKCTRFCVQTRFGSTKCGA